MSVYFKTITVELRDMSCHEGNFLLRLASKTSYEVVPDMLPLSDVVKAQHSNIFSSTFFSFLHGRSLYCCGSTLRFLCSYLTKFLLFNNRF